MTNSQLFKQAHKMTKLTIKPDETYRYKFGQWLIFLKTGVSNKLGITNINQSVAYIPILAHDKIAKADKFTYSLSLPLTLTRRKGAYSESYYLGKIVLLSTVLYLLAYLML